MSSHPHASLAAPCIASSEVVVMVVVVVVSIMFLI
jgi:hypothetical protein